MLEPEIIIKDNNGEFETRYVRFGDNEIGLKRLFYLALQGVNTDIEMTNPKDLESHLELRHEKSVICAFVIDLERIE